MGQADFSDLTDVYEAMIDWPKRLAHEEPFYRHWFESSAVKSVVDVACGTGHHAAMFFAWGLRVEGSDLSPTMIQRARADHGHSDGLRWVVRSFDEPIRTTEPFHAAVCVGNSMALAADTQTVELAIHRMMDSVSDRGLIVVHVLNLWRLPDGPCVWQKCKQTMLRQQEVLILKGIHRCGSQGFVELVVTRLSGSLEIQHETVPFLGLEADGLERMARRAGAARVQCFGGYQEQPYDRHQSTDLIMVAQRH